MLKAKVQDAINKHINAELYSSYLYLSMAAYLETKSLPGFVNWMKVQVEEERFHGMKMFDYVNERGGRIILGAIEQPKSEWNSLLEVFEDVYKHEQHVTELINNLMDIAHEERDHATISFLQWYVNEQVEEESNCETLLNQLKIINGEGNGVLMMDREVAARVFTPPVA